MRDCLGVLLAGGAGERLFPLTRDRAKPAVPFAGQYRIIDITLSNCINSDLRHVYILTQYKALSLNRHIREGWGPVVANELGEFIEILPPMQRVSKSWYQGHGGCGVPEHLFDRVGRAQVRHHPFRRPHLQDELWPACCSSTRIPVRKSRWRRCRSGRKMCRNLAWLRWRVTVRCGGLRRSPSRPCSGRRSTRRWVDASMGIYIFNTDVLLPELIRDAEDPNLEARFRSRYPSRAAWPEQDARVQLRG